MVYYQRNIVEKDMINSNRFFQSLLINYSLFVAMLYNMKKLSVKWMSPSFLFSRYEYIQKWLSIKKSKAKLLI